MASKRKRCIGKEPFCSAGRWRRWASPRSQQLRLCPFARAFACRRCRVCVYKSVCSCPGDDVTAGNLTCCLQSAACRLSWRSDQTLSSTRSHTAPQTSSRLLQETHIWRKNILKENVPINIYLQKPDFTADLVRRKIITLQPSSWWWITLP